MENKAETVLIEVAEKLMVLAKDSTEQARKLINDERPFSSEAYFKMTDAYMNAAGLILEQIKKVQNV